MGIISIVILILFVMAGRLKMAKEALPLFGFIGLGCVICTVSCLRHTFVNPDLNVFLARETKTPTTFYRLFGIRDQSTHIEKAPAHISTYGKPIVNYPNQNSHEKVDE